MTQHCQGSPALLLPGEIEKYRTGIYISENLLERDSAGVTGCTGMAFPGKQIQGRHH